jgi:hypothetical protein
MNQTLDLRLRLVKGGDRFTIEGIEFENAALIEPGETSGLNSVPELSNALICWTEIIRSTKVPTGRFLIFTSPTGIADDGGWTGVKVTHANEVVIWDFFAGDVAYCLKFDKFEYLSTLSRIAEQIKDLDKTIVLEPVQIFYPECWGQSL